VLIVVGLIFLFFYRRTQEQNTRVYAAITRLQATGIQTQQQLMERSRRAREDEEHGLSRPVIRKRFNSRRRAKNCDRKSQSAGQKTLLLCRSN